MGGKNMVKNKKQFLKEAGVLLFVVMMIFSSSTAIANINNNNVSINTADINSVNPQGFSANRDLIWDNAVGVYGSYGGIIVATVRAEGTAFPADDFKLDEQRKVDSLFWQGGYFQCQLAQGQKDYNWNWRILFWDDCGDGTHPGNEIYNWTIPDASIQREFWYIYTHPTNGNTYWIANYSADLPETVTFDADTIYWITIQAIQGSNAYPQGCWSRHNESVGGIKLHEAVIKAAYWGYPDWTNIAVLVTDKLPHDLNYQLFGPALNSPPNAPGINGPTKGKTGTSIEYTFNAVDPNGDQVKYLIDWGDGKSDTTNLNLSGIDVIVAHTWDAEGTFVIKVKAEDAYGLISPETTLSVKIPRIKIVTNTFLQRFLQNYPNLFTIIQKILQQLEQ
jgi:hypothetical protein